VSIDLTSLTILDVDHYKAHSFVKLVACNHVRYHPFRCIAARMLSVDRKELGKLRSWLQRSLKDQNDFIRPLLSKIKQQESVSAYHQRLHHAILQPNE
jgi:hypothetical protein